ncbi:MAG: metallophosphoesterase [Clostridia bacterium]|nr:metallophosphoesterase [Clostridia bacterium]
MKKLKLLFCILLSLTMLFSVTACDGENESSLVSEITSTDESEEGKADDSVESDTLHLSVEFADPDSNRIACKITAWTENKKEAGTYALSFANEDGAIKTIDSIATMTLKAGEENKVSIEPFNDLCIAPAGATRIALCRIGKVYSSVKLPQSKLRTGSSKGRFAILSDVHMINDKDTTGHNGYFDLKKAFECIKKAGGVEYVCVTGDIGFDSTEEEIALFARQRDNYCSVPVYAVRGNHDKKMDSAMWEKYMGNKPNFSKEINGVGYVFLSLDDTVNNNVETDKEHATAMDWVEKEVAKYGKKGMPVFLYMHYPIPGEAGLIPGSYYGFSESCTEDDRIVALMKKYDNMVVFSGHTHFDFESQKTYKDIMVKKLAGSNSYTVHIPSNAYTRDYKNATDTSGGQFYIAEYANKKLILTGINTMNGRTSALGCYEIDLGA